MYAQRKHISLKALHAVTDWRLLYSSGHLRIFAAGLRSSPNRSKIKLALISSVVDFSCKLISIFYVHDCSFDFILTILNWDS